eukprot:3521023-Pyramimonas_sp.AAC.1
MPPGFPRRPRWPPEHPSSGPVGPRGSTVVRKDGGPRARGRLEHPPSAPPSPRWRLPSRRSS